MTIEVEFYNCGEVRMGSPFNACKIRLRGRWIPELPQDVTWQDRIAQSPDGQYTALVYWDTPKNEPGFRVVTVDELNKTVCQSERVLGLCKEIWWGNNQFEWAAVLVNSGKITVRH
ncbi:MAG: hypothetical protein DRI37_09615 [Chloroflexi bacterium]|nr:MAG: hypothetical protein DRI37_09615 [Chloroflexota bacterium]